MEEIKGKFKVGDKVRGLNYEGEQSYSGVITKIINDSHMKLDWDDTDYLGWNVNIKEDGTWGSDGSIGTLVKINISTVLEDIKEKILG